LFERNPAKSYSFFSIGFRMKSLKSISVAYPGIRRITGYKRAGEEVRISFCQFVKLKGPQRKNGHDFNLIKGECLNNWPYEVQMDGNDGKENTR